MELSEIKNLKEIEKKTFSLILKKLKKEIKQKIEEISLPKKEIELTSNHKKILSYLFNIYYEDSIYDKKTYKSIENIFQNIFTENDYTLYETRYQCYDLEEMNLLEKRENSFYISKYGILFLQSQREDWDNELTKNLILCSVNLEIKNTIDRIMFEEI